VQRSQNETSQCNLLGRKLYVEESFAKSAKRIQNFRPIGKPPELAFRKFPRRRSIQHLPRHVNNRIDSSIQRHKLRLGSGCCNGIGINPDGGQTQ